MRFCFALVFGVHFPVLDIHVLPMGYPMMDIDDDGPLTNVQASCESRAESAERRAGDEESARRDEGARWQTDRQQLLEDAARRLAQARQDAAQVQPPSQLDVTGQLQSI